MSSIPRHNKKGVSLPPNWRFKHLAHVAGGILAATCLIHDAGAQNLLENGNFNAPIGSTWNQWTYSGGWAGSSTNPDEAYDGSQFVYMGGNDGQGGGFNQVLFGQAGVPYTFSCVSAVNAWWWPEAQMRLIFLDASDAELLLSSTNCAAGITAFDTGLSWSNYTMTVTSPPGTVKVKAEFATFGHGTVRFDNAMLTAPLVYPTIDNVYPNGSALMQITNKLAFVAASTATAIDVSGIQVTVNGVDVSSELNITGTSMNRNVVYSGIRSNRTYTVAIKVTDTTGLIASRAVSFDTFSPDYYTWEAEDYDFSGGLFIDNPQTNYYFDLLGTPEVDYHAASNDGIQYRYRTADTVGTEVTSDATRPQYAGTNDFSVGWWDSGEWLNYTRTLPSGLFNVYARMSSPSSSSITLSRVLSGVGTDTQTTESLGNFVLEQGLGWGTYSWAPLVDASGNMVKLNLGGKTTLRATASGNANFQFVMLVPADTNAPTITDLYPNGTTQFQATNKLQFTANSSAGINPGSILVTLNATNVTTRFSTNLTATNGLVITGTANSRIVSYTGLIPGASYAATIRVTDQNNNTVSINPKFDTYAPVAVWDAEDYDFNGGQSLNNAPVNAYANLAGIEGVDFHDSNSLGNRPYRSQDPMSSDVVGDTPRAAYLSPVTNDYGLGYFATGEWVNYTRTLPAGTYNIYGRFAAGGDPGVLSLGLITNGVGTAEQSVKPLGLFNTSFTGSWGTYQFFPLRDEFGNLAQVTLAGGASTLKLQRVSGADANVNFFMLVAPDTTLPRILGVSPTKWLSSSNALKFVVDSASPVELTNIAVQLNGVTATNLVFGGTPTSRTVSGTLAPNTVYTAIISVTNNLGLTARSTVNFDTFSASAYTWEAEDFDYDGGKFYDNPQIQAYFLLDATEGIDFHDSTNGGSAIYRSTTLATEITSDTLRAGYDSTVVRDHNIGYTTAGEWANYTRTYPSGKFNVYMRAARGDSGTGSMGLQLVTSGWGTANQTTEDLGRFTIPNTGAWQTFQWVPLQDAAGNLKTIDLKGKTTLRLTDGGANVNFFMLTPALFIDMTPSQTGLNFTFGTQLGFNYTVQYTDNLSGGAWTELITFTGDGTVKSTSATRVAAPRFYRLQIH